MRRKLVCSSLLLAASMPWSHGHADPAPGMTTKIGFTSGAYLTIPAEGSVEKSSLMEREQDLYDSIQTFKNPAYDIVLMELRHLGQSCKTIVQSVLHAPTTPRSRKLKVEAFRRHGIDLVREDAELRSMVGGKIVTSRPERRYTVCKGKTHLVISASTPDAAAAAKANPILDRAIDSLVVP